MDLTISSLTAIGSLSSLSPHGVKAPQAEARPSAVASPPRYVRGQAVPGVGHKRGVQRGEARPVALRVERPRRATWQSRGGAMHKAT